MQAEEVKVLLEAGLENCDVSVDGDGSHYNLLIVGEVFAGLRPVKRQQLVYAVLSDQIADGSIHAVNMRTFTAEEWREQAG